MSKSARILLATVIFTALIMIIIGAIYYFWGISNNQNAVSTTNVEKQDDEEIIEKNVELGLVGYSDSLPVVATVKQSQLNGDLLTPGSYSYVVSITSPQPATGITIQLASPVTLFPEGESTEVFTLPNTISSMVNSATTTNKGTTMQLAAITMPPSEPMTSEFLLEGISFATTTMAQTEVLFGTVEIVHPDNSVTFGKIGTTVKSDWTITAPTNTSQTGNESGI